MVKQTAPIASNHQKDGLTCLSLEFDPDSDGWFLYGHSAPDAAPSLELWNMSEDDAKDMAQNDWGVSPSDWSTTGASDKPETRDCNGTPLQDGDTVTLIKDLDVKGAGTTLKRGTTVKNITLTDDPELIDCRTKEVKGLVLKTCFVKKI